MQVDYVFSLSLYECIHGEYRGSYTYYLIYRFVFCAFVLVQLFSIDGFIEGPFGVGADARNVGESHATCCNPICHYDRDIQHVPATLATLPNLGITCDLHDIPTCDLHDIPPV